MTTATFVHTGISTTDLDRCVAWYGRIFGLKETKRFEKESLRLRAAMLEDSTGGVIEILAPYTPRPAPETATDLPSQLERTGVNHIALSVPDVRASFVSVREAGAALIGDLIDEKMFFCADPDGTVLEVRQA